MSTTNPIATNRLPDAFGSNASIMVGMSNQEVHAERQTSWSGATRLAIHIGSLSLLLSVEQWHSLAATVDSVLPKVAS